MACGVPVISTRARGIPDYITDYKIGILVEPSNSEQLANKIIELLNNPDLRVKLGRNASFEVKKEYSWEKISEKIISVYKKILIY